MTWHFSHRLELVTIYFLFLTKLHTETNWRPNWKKRSFSFYFISFFAAFLKLGYTTFSHVFTDWNNETGEKSLFPSAVSFWNQGWCWEGWTLWAGRVWGQVVNMDGHLYTVFTNRRHTGGKQRAWEKRETVCFVMSEWKQAVLRPSPNIQNETFTNSFVFIEITLLENNNTSRK